MAPLGRGKPQCREVSETWRGILSQRQCQQGRHGSTSEQLGEQSQHFISQSCWTALPRLLSFPKWLASALASWTPTSASPVPESVSGQSSSRPILLLCDPRIFSSDFYLQNTWWSTDDLFSHWTARLTVETMFTLRVLVFTTCLVLDTDLENVE